MSQGPQENFEERVVHLKDLKAFFYLLQYGKGDRGLFITAILFLFFASLTGVLSARVLGELAQTIQSSALNESYKWGACIIVLEVSAIVLLYYGRRWLAKASLNSILRVRKALFNHIQNLPMKFFDTQPQGRIVTRITHDVDTMESFFTSTLARLSNAIITFFVVFIAMVIVDWRIGCMITASMIPVFILTYLVRQPLRKWNREFSRRNAMINAKLSEFLNGIPVIRAFGVEAWSKREFDSVVNHHLEAAIKINQLNSWSRPLIMFLTSLPLAFFIGFGGMAVINATISLAVFVTFVRLAERFLQPMSVISQEMHVVQSSLINTERVASF
ncbi:ABC transporter ATP-binding protein, partial [bacterium]|nr:ABC transporter ATP-binding protein [bacterium]